MLVSFPGAGCDPRAVGIVDSEPLGNRCDKHTFSAMGHADEVEPVVERDLASLGDASCLKGSWFRRLTRGSQGPWWGWAASERQKKLRVGDGLGRAIREGDQPGVSLRLQSQGQSSPGNAQVVDMAIQADGSTASDAAG